MADASDSPEWPILVKGGGDVPHTAFGGLLFTGVVFFYYVFVNDTSALVLCFLKAKHCDVFSIGIPRGPFSLLVTSRSGSKH